jgi:hypothetical protein
MASNKKDLKAYVRYDGTGRVIAGSLILQRFKPKDGNWQEVQAYECCDPSCPNTVYNEDWIIYDIQEIYGGVIISVATNPFTGVTIQLQNIDCVTGLGIGEIITVGPDTGTTYEWFVPSAVWDESCDLQTRRICGFNYQSAWTLFGF